MNVHCKLLGRSYVRKVAITNLRAQSLGAQVRRLPPCRSWLKEWFGINPNAEILEKLSAMQTDLSEVKKEVSEVKKEVSEVKKEVSEVKKEVSEVKKEVSRLERSSGKILEVASRSEIRQIVGVGASKLRLVQSILDVRGLLPANDERPILNEEDPILNNIIGKLMGTNSTSIETPTNEFLEAITCDLKALSIGGNKDVELEILGRRYKEKCLNDSDGSLTKMEVLKTFIGALEADEGKEGRLKETLVRFKRYLEASPEKRMSQLCDPDGLGLCLALFLSAKESKALNKKSPILQLCEEILELDVQGEVIVTNNIANIWTGEIKSSSKSLKVAKEQLEKRLDLLEWAVRSAWPEVEHCTRRGKIFIPESEAEINLPARTRISGRGTNTIFDIILL
ncbi:hypothetical protein CEUSTIGMA_g4035.t1 [Chlamydomonas eustigma]|uniref:Uncharacterized protein n=1 Tax=Chlamydomonas eustigma TaxID=1157962 RepID=A0A250X0Y2_9CHLO|nr:hypothetical protein CEUSTIGMA_g4035.t1 [Chlamydomonas eustigma]|eukprot:GAX76589.1 hypothetical protein CEUSTIGMA_g4035.t1 [Chlamydomonas eustigma]